MSSKDHALGWLRLLIWSTLTKSIPSKPAIQNSPRKPMKLRRNERCPIHKSFFCCGRERGWRRCKPWAAVERIEDPHHPRGYRERRSPAEMKKLLDRKIVEQDMKC